MSNLDPEEEILEAFESGKQKKPKNAKRQIERGCRKTPFTEGIQ